MNLIKIIGVDIDFYSESKQIRLMFLESIREKSINFGTIIHDRKTKRGHHFKVKLNKQVNFWRSIEIRHYLHDDIKRMFYDILRYRSGSKMIDILYDVKKTNYKIH